MPRGRKKLLTPALEDYLVIIYEIILKDPAARVSSIARMLHVSFPSVTNAMKRLADLGYVNYKIWSNSVDTKGKEEGKPAENKPSQT